MWRWQVSDYLAGYLSGMGGGICVGVAILLVQLSYYNRIIKKISGKDKKD
jgi:hypothetical protein